MDKIYDRMDFWWRALPLRKQRKYILCFFAGYALLTTGVLLKIQTDARKEPRVGMEYIERPAGLQDTLLTILKDKK